MFGTLTTVDLNAVWNGNLEAISDFFCGSGHVIPKHAIVASISELIFLSIWYSFKKKTWTLCLWWWTTLKTWSSTFVVMFLLFYTGTIFSQCASKRYPVEIDAEAIYVIIGHIKQCFVVISKRFTTLFLSTVRIPADQNSLKWRCTAIIWNLVYIGNWIVCCIKTYISYPFNIWVSVICLTETGILKDFVCEMCVLT